MKNFSEFYLTNIVDSTLILFTQSLVTVLLESIDQIH